MAIMFCVPGVCILLLTLFLGTQCEPGLIRVKYGSVSEEITNDQDTHSFCLEYNSMFHKLPDSYEGQHPSSMVNFSSAFGCIGNFHSNISGKVVAIARGNCTFVQKASNIQEHGGIAALIVDYLGESSHSTPDGNGSGINIAVAIISHEDFDTMMLQANGDEVRVWLYAPRPPDFDPNLVLMFLLAIACVMLGSYWSASVHHKRATSWRLVGKREDGEDSVSLGMGVITSVVLVIFFCLSITLLYFFYDYLVYVIMAIFSFAGVNAIFHALLPLWKKLAPWDHRIPYISVLCFKRIKKMPEVRSIVLLAVSTGFVVTWFCLRHESYAWIMQDVIGFCFCLYVMRALLMPSLRACSVLLGLLFVYDIFFVFITPLFTKNGESVMIKVATGGNSRSGEQMPTVFKLPYFLSWAMAGCIKDRYSLLGFGDVIVPGLLITYNCAFDMKTRSTSSQSCRLLYFTVSSIAYMVGLLLTGVALYVMKSGQPALLYLVPCTLLTTIVTALVQQDLVHMWRGHQCPKKDDDAEASGTVAPSSNEQHEEDAETLEESEHQSLIQ